MSAAPSTEGRTAVLLMAYGTPRHPDEIETYYTDIRRGRPPTPEQLADLTARYAAIGGTSPLSLHTENQRLAIETALEGSAPGRFDVVTGFKHIAPTIEDTAGVLAAAGHTRIVALALAPHYSSASIGQYLDRTRAAAQPHGIEVIGVESWATDKPFVEFLADEVLAALEAMPEATTVVFTAHSLPRRVIEAGPDAYPDEVLSTARAVAASAGLDTWTTGWQSAGRTEEPWLGPDILDLIDQLAAGGSDGVLVCACGFVADHLEVLYDLDIEARRRAAAAGLAFARTASVNADPSVMAGLAARIRAAAG